MENSENQTIMETSKEDFPDAFGSNPSAGGVGYYSSSGYHNSTQHGAIAQLANKGFNSSTPNYTARMPTDRHAVEYNMGHRNRGLALIFNHEHFTVQTLKSRSGTNVDCDNLARCLKQLDFDVQIHKDCTLKELVRHVEWAANQDHTNSDCILITILSHGELGYIYAKDTQYKLDSIWSYFTAQHCPTLAGKPKLFFIQACQGDRLDGGVTLKRVVTQTDAYSTIPGFYSWRNTTRGSWFMQSLCAELAANGKRYDILTLLTFVCQRVAVDFESCTPDTPDMHQQKQIPCITTMLTRILRFSDKNSTLPAARV
ncbi:death related ICE-like caspase isoform X2 [Haematobia irritans]|uniref:death related ICE-like caspase isoform X2 n=1 Tax=Haematobia irritans TaxID=7368 RepID=UPI003F5091CD